MGRPKFSFEKENELRKQIAACKEHRIRRLPHGQSPQEQVYQALRGLIWRKCAAVLHRLPAAGLSGYGLSGYGSPARA
jgi:hypothetical protein